jgi:hypothetical protein
MVRRRQAFETRRNHGAAGACHVDPACYRFCSSRRCPPWRDRLEIISPPSSCCYFVPNVIRDTFAMCKAFSMIAVAPYATTTSGIRADLLRQPKIETICLWGDSHEH